jgi:rhamnose utilization protein RhaD (predicted bifunctional aldolase and dehydrogenase)
MSIDALAEASRYYGANADYVIAGGGNSSFKDKETLYVKASGTALVDAVPEAFVRMDRKALARMWEKGYPTESAVREKEVLADLMAARKDAGEQKRPSVETMIHDLLPFDYVVHLHPALVNGLTCSQQGEEAAKELFADEAIWIPSANPGYVLSLMVKKAMEDHKTKHGQSVAIIFLQNHGVFVGAQTVEEIKGIYRDIIGRIEKKIKRRPDFSGESRDAPWEYISAVRGISKGSAAFIRNNEIAAFIKDRASFYPFSSAFTPDHIVYAGSNPMFTEAETEEDGWSDWKRYLDTNGRQPKIVAVRRLGVFGLGPTEKAAALALELLLDAVKVAVYSESFGGPKFMDRDKIDFINNWEVEAFRAKESTK